MVIITDSPGYDSRLTDSSALPACADGSQVHALIVDDEPVLAELLSIVLRHEGWKVATAGDGSSALRCARTNPPDILVLDIGLPDMDGLEVMRSLRSQRPNLPVLLLTAKASAEDRIAGLAHGGDDYVTKPFSVEEVVLRLRALVKRSGVVSDVDTGRIVVADLVLDMYSHDVTRAGKTISLTSTEFRLLRYLMRNMGRVVSKSQILQEVWKDDFGGSPNVVEIFISYLRKKIDAGGQPPLIHTIRGSGYLLRAR